MGESTRTNGDDRTSTAEVTAEGSADYVIEMESEGDDHYFDPVGLYVEPGQSVAFVIESGHHSSTAYAEGNASATDTRIPEGADAWNSGELNGHGASFTYTFSVEGTYDYFCIPHKSKGMVGRIIVGNPGGPGEEGTPPDGEVPDSRTIVERGAVTFSEFTS